VQLVHGFDWDAGNRDKCRKHGVSIVEIEALFRHPHHVFPDPAHSSHETRLLAIGTGGGGRHIFVAFTMRQRGRDRLIRPISARYMHAKEIAHYEESIARSDQ
jgi:uncharacterized protein